MLPVDSPIPETRALLGHQGAINTTVVLSSRILRRTRGMRAIGGNANPRMFPPLNIRIRRDSIIYEVKTIRPLSLPVPIPAQRAAQTEPNATENQQLPPASPLRAPPASPLTPSRSSSPYHKSTPNKYKRGVGKEGGNKKRTDGFYFVDNRITPDSYNLHL